MNTYDLVVIGTGMGGGSLAYGLRDSGRKILVLERGDYLPSEPENWSPDAVFAQTRYKPKEQWFDENGQPFAPGVHYFVGGNTKVYGAALQRLRKEDFSESNTKKASPPPGRFRTRNSSPTIAGPKRCSRCMANRAMIQPNRRARPPFPFQP